MRQGTTVEIRAATDAEGIRNMLIERFRFNTKVNLDVADSSDVRNFRSINGAGKRDGIHFLVDGFVRVRDESGAIENGYSLSPGYCLAHTPAQEDRSPSRGQTRAIYITIDQLTVLRFLVPGAHGPRETVISLPDNTRVNLSRRQMASDVTLYRYFNDMIKTLTGRPDSVYLLDLVLHRSAARSTRCSRRFSTAAARRFRNDKPRGGLALRQNPTLAVLPECEALRDLDRIGAEDGAWAGARARRQEDFLHQPGPMALARRRAQGNRARSRTRPLARRRGRQAARSSARRSCLTGARGFWQSSTTWWS